jgi:AcrR family transcriptional regulator
MIESISQRGYGATTVAHVIALAGVSRRAFYEQFSNKEECFLATYDIVVARSRKLVLNAWSSERGWANRLHASCKSFLDDIAAEPKGARLVLVDSLGIGPKARERLHLAGISYERLIAAAFKVSPDKVPLPAIASRAIVGGIRHVVSNRIREDRLSELRTLTDELLDWAEAYRSPATTRLHAIALKEPPEIRPAPATFLAGDDKRTRVLGAVVHLTLDEGYAELTDPQIAQFAGISTEAFHKQFASKEECLLAAIDEFAEEALEAVESAIAGASSWQSAVHIAVTTFIEHLVARPALLRMTFVDLFEVGPGMIGRMTKSVDRFTALMTGRGPDPRRAPEVVSEALAGSVWDIISAYAANDRLLYLPCLADHIAFVLLAPYVGPKVAIETIEVARFGFSQAPGKLGQTAGSTAASEPDPQSTEKSARRSAEQPKSGQAKQPKRGQAKQSKAQAKQPKAGQTEQAKQRRSAKPTKLDQAEQSKPGQAEQLQPGKAQPPDPQSAKQSRPRSAKQPKPRPAKQPKPRSAEKPKPRRSKRPKPPTSE